MGNNPATPDDFFAFHLEDIGEIAADGDFQVEADRVAIVVGDFHVLPHAAADMAAQRQAEGFGRDRTILRAEFGIGLEDASAEVGDRAAVQQVPLLSIGIDVPTADDPGIEEVQTFVAGPGNLAVRVGDQHRLPLVDRDLRRADLNLESHRLGPFFPECRYNTAGRNVSSGICRDRCPFGTSGLPVAGVAGSHPGGQTGGYAACTFWRSISAGVMSRSGPARRRNRGVSIQAGR